MSFVLAQAVTAAGSGGAPSSVNVAYGSNVTLNNLLLGVAWGRGNATGSLTIADSASNTWATAASVKHTLSADTDYLLYLFYAVANATGACTLTITNVSGLQTVVGGYAIEYSGNATTSPLDGTGVTSFNDATSPRVTVNPGSITVTGAGELLLSAVMFDSDFSDATPLAAASGFAVEASGNEGVSANRQIDVQRNLNSGTGSQALAWNATGGQAAAWVAVGAAFLPTASGDTSTTQQRMVAVQSLIEQSGSLGVRWV